MLSVVRSVVTGTVKRGLHTTRTLLADAPVGNPEVLKRIGDIVKKDKVVVFMKGDRLEPQCGYSNAVVQILRMHGVDQYQTVNVLADADIRQGIKEYSKWPTIPQVFLDGEFIGGCDIMMQMHKSGELMETLRKAGIDSKIPDPPKSSDETAQSTTSV